MWECEREWWELRELEWLSVLDEWGVVDRSWGEMLRGVGELLLRWLVENEVLELRWEPVRRSSFEPQPPSWSEDPALPLLPCE